MPKLSEKNACPSALITTPGVTFEKSGFRKNSTPSPAWGSDNDIPQNTSNSTKSSGISTLESFSIPFCTPRSNITRLRIIIT